MPHRSPPPPPADRPLDLERVDVAALVVEDDADFAHVGAYRALRRALAQDGARFWVPRAGHCLSWDRVLFLNLTFWNAAEAADVLASRHVPGDALAHAAWHHLARKAFPGRSADTLFFGESIASAFDVYLVGRLLGHAPGAAFLETQVPRMADACEAAGLEADAFESLLGSIAEDPERAFEDLRSLLYDATRALLGCRGPGEALAVLEGFGAHRFAPLLHHYELSNWILYSKAYAHPSAGEADPAGLDRALRAADRPLEHLEATWLAPYLD